MARYSKETTAALKRVLMCRRDKGYRFNQGDMPELMEKTGLSRAEIVQWAVIVRNYYDSPEAMEKFFEKNGTVSGIQHLLVTSLGQKTKNLETWIGPCVPNYTR